ncbi:MAG: exosome complex RNA-binding protein Csl4 [Candidatus Hydrothermarchaeota archaeon]
MKVKSGDFVVPGDILGVSEEFIPGEGTYEEKGKVFASLTGIVLIDLKEKVISIFPKTSTPPTLKDKDVVMGKVIEIRDQLVLVDVSRLKGREDRELPVPTLAGIHISQVKDAYVNSLTEEFRPGDIITASVINAGKLPLQLSTVQDHLGVIKAYCSKCRASMVKKNRRSLICPRCKNMETRKLSTLYGKGMI